jgi:hypothetical protein
VEDEAKDDNWDGERGEDDHEGTSDLAKGTVYGAGMRVC